MKNNLLMLLKIEFLKFLSSFNSKGKKISRTPILYLALFIALAAIGFTTLYSFLILLPFQSEGLDSSIAVTIFAGVTATFTFMTSLSQVRSIYIGEDYDFLASLPIKKGTIVASKVISIYVIELVFSTIVMVPHGIMQIVMVNSMTNFFISLLLAFTLPIVPIAISVVISLFVTILTARFKSANTVFVIFYTLFVVAISMVGVLVNNMKGSEAASVFSSIGNVIKWVNPSYYFVELSLGGNKLFLLIYLAINLGSAIFTVLFITLLFDRLHEIVSSISMKNNYVRKDLKTKGLTKVLLSLEFHRLFNSKIYFANAIMGSIMTIIGSAVFLFSMSAPLKDATPDAAQAIRLLEGPIYIVICIMIIGICNPTTGCINIEGKNFWIIKSLPIDYKKYMHVRLLFSWILTLPACLISSTIAVIFMHNSVYEIIFVYLIPLFYSILNSLIGLIVATKHPKLKWSSEAEAVKNSASVLIAMLINFGATIVLGGILIALPFIFLEAPVIPYIIGFVLVIIPIIPTYLYLRKNFSKKIIEIEDL